MAKKTIKDVDVSGKRVVIRVDFNVPMTDSGEVADDARIAAAKPSIDHITANGGKAIIVAHFGRPKGEVKDDMRLAKIAPKISEVLGKDVQVFDPFAEGWDAAEAASKALPEGGVMMLENIRFHPGETKNDPELAKQIASLADIYCNDAFGAAHRAHSSTAGAAAHVDTAVAGLLMAKEIENLTKYLMDDPARPFIALIGGAKVSTKLGVLESMCETCDKVFIGGAMAYTFYLAKGYPIGKSLHEPDLVETAKGLLDKFGDKISLPIDTVYADEFSDDANVETYLVEDVPADCDMQGLDIGPETISQMEDAIMTSKTIFWNGPMGVLEIERFAEGTQQVARFLLESEAVSVVGGGETAMALEYYKDFGTPTFVSTGGGACLEFVEGKELPGVACLQDA